MSTLVGKNAPAFKAKAVVNGNTCTITTADGDATVTISGRGSGSTYNQSITPDGDFDKLGGIIGTAIASSSALTEEECEQFNISKNGNSAKSNNSINPFSSSSRISEALAVLGLSI